MTFLFHNIIRFEPLQMQFSINEKNNNNKNKSCKRIIDKVENHVLRYIHWSQIKTLSPFNGNGLKFPRY